MGQWPMDHSAIPGSDATELGPATAEGGFRCGDRVRVLTNDDGWMNKIARVTLVKHPRAIEIEYKKTTRLYCVAALERA